MPLLDLLETPTTALEALDLEADVAMSTPLRAAQHTTRWAHGREREGTWHAREQKFHTTIADHSRCWHCIFGLSWHREFLGWHTKDHGVLNHFFCIWHVKYMKDLLQQKTIDGEVITQDVEPFLVKNRIVSEEILLDWRYTVSIEIAPHTVGEVDASVARALHVQAQIRIIRLRMPTLRRRAFKQRHESLSSFVLRAVLEAFGKHGGLSSGVHVRWTQRVILERTILKSKCVHGWIGREGLTGIWRGTGSVEVAGFGRFEIRWKLYRMLKMHFGVN